MIRRLLGHLAPERGRLAALFAAMLCGAGVEMLAPWPLKLAVDQVIGRQPLGTLSPDALPVGVLLSLVALAHVVLAGVRGLLGLLRRRWLAQVSQAASLALRADLYARVQRLSLGFHDRARVGDLVTRITRDVDQLQEAFIDGLSMVFVDLLTVGGIAGVMLLVDWQFALIAWLVVPPLVVIYSTVRGRVREAARDARSGEGAVASVAQEVLTSIRVVRAFGQEEREQARFLEQTRSTAAANVRAATWEGIFDLWVEVATAAGVALVLGYGAWRVLEGSLTLGAMLVFVQYVIALYSPVRRLARLTSIVQKASASSERVEELFRAAPDVPERATARSLVRTHGEIRFEDVWFSYTPNRPVLRGVDLTIMAGERVAIMGPTGAGKSTLASLVGRFYDPQGGRVLLDGIDLRDLRLGSLRQQVAIVLQDTLLFAGTVRDNIAYGRPDASDEQIQRAARAAYAEEFILHLTEGYDAEVGERGVTLSGGQRQRIAIARALLKDAPILVLDEPTSAVDPESERLIMAALAHLVRGRTVLIITHRPSMAHLANRTLHLADGVLADRSQGAYDRRKSRLTI